jgi:hypothetical protein
MGAWMKASIELYSILKVDDVHDTHP